MDDLAVPIEPCDTVQLVDDVEIVCSVFARIVASCGLEVSFAAGKSEAVLQVVGRRAEAARKPLAEFELNTPALPLR